MKKLFALVLTTVMAVAMVACGGSGNDPQPTNTPEPTPSQTVQLTMDNWQDYFEIVEKEEPQKNRFDEVENIFFTNYLVLKNGYEIFEPSVGNEYTDIDIEYSYDTEKRWYTLDENGVATWGEVEPYENGRTEIVSLTSGGNLLPFCIEHSHSYSTGRYICVKTNITVTRIQGTLYLK